MAQGRWLIVGCAALAVSLPIATVQQIPASDPHAGRFTVGTGFSCALCHSPRGPQAERMRAGAALMSKMVAALNTGPLRNTGGIDCISCHRGGGQEHNMLHPRPLDRSLVRTRIESWPGNPRDPEDLRRTMTEYNVSLGVECSYCHTPGDWKAAGKPALQSTRRMVALMNEFPKYFDFANAAAFTCFTCHQGALKVPRR